MTDKSIEVTSKETLFSTDIGHKLLHMTQRSRECVEKISCSSLVIYWLTNEEPKLIRDIASGDGMQLQLLLIRLFKLLASGFLHPILMANTRCPIELEPRTLNQVQLTQAREIAAEVVQKLEPCEASALFIEEVLEMEENENLTEKLADCMKKAESVTEQNKACHCQCSCATENSFKDPLSAPF
ncbi:uncharacterized protein [Phaseolus vulgaris]|uniref:uncharacterized protein isoform X2 n=1 Tax=Phaseolus vulgaris TaxID=3885 RepID=UPI0035CB3B24